MQIHLGDDIPQRAALWYDLCTRTNKRIRIMKRPAYDKEALRENKGGMQVGQPSADPQQTQETTRTQITPDDISDDGPIAPASANGTPSRQQIEQDVVAVNPSVDSMESRG